MRYPRHAKVFRGQIDAAPLASVFFLLVIFLFLNYSLVFVPGIMINLEEPRETSSTPLPRLNIARSGELTYRKSEMSLEKFEQRIKEESLAGKAPTVIYYKADPEANRQLIQQIKNLAIENGIILKRPGDSMEVPDFAGFPGEPGPVVVVTVNLNGQIFYQHQLVREERLLGYFQEAIQKEGNSVKLVLQTDKEVAVEVVMRLSAIARQAGISKVALAHKPKAPDPL
ncbi:MAG: ExbD/TolR family protein [Verrucomicrobiales bacterium]